MSLEKEIAFKQKELDLLKMRASGTDGVQKLQRVWDEVLWTLGPEAPLIPHARFLLLLTKLIYYNQRYGSFLERDFELEILDVLEAKEANFRGKDSYFTSWGPEFDSEEKSGDA